VDIVRVLKDINLNVVSAEVDTVGSKAQVCFYVVCQYPAHSSVYIAHMRGLQLQRLSYKTLRTTAR
jgi:UTP:GlnB (protein PII) uridylyltransferase